MTKYHTLFKQQVNAPFDVSTSHCAIKPAKPSSNPACTSATA
ncbi:hypothetical protein [Haemophilus influenzae]|nr:hypothetical protein [Haemophilus influenzae]